jgi:hypothetical protein
MKGRAIANIPGLRDAAHVEKSPQQHVTSSQNISVSERFRIGTRSA